MNTGLYAANHPSRFWRPLLETAPPPEAWEEAARAAAEFLPDAARAATIQDLLAATLGEGQFGNGHWRLSRPRRLYYLAKPLLPRQAVLRARRAAHGGAQRAFPLGWPVEDRFRRFLWATMGGLLERLGLDEAPFVYFWPHGARYALVLTHDVEMAEGQGFAAQVADREEQLGFRSSFNFVTERYPLDRGLIHDLRSRGFEVGVHGLRHDGRELRSERAFVAIACRLNEHLRDFGAVGFRSPLTHRHPEWLQALDVEYDSSFFDTDPYEPLPGGTMSIFPFSLGRFIELPYTLAQDSTLLDVMGERTPRLWLEKVAYIERWGGMALLNTHPDYLRRPGHWEVYAALLDALRTRGTYWNPLPREAARWWRRRADGPASALEERRQGLLRRGEAGEVEVVAAAQQPVAATASKVPVVRLWGGGAAVPSARE
jgi:hypothetical protein